MDYQQIFSSVKERSLHGRYIPPQVIEPLLAITSRKHNTTIIARSVLGSPIYAYKIGSGTTRILMWSQMHGNESTATKALFDLYNFLESGQVAAIELLKSVTICVVPMLNPDGAAAYTRTNANDVDLNRDFVSFSQPESKALHELYVSFNPVYCYNLHDQRTIFGVSGQKLPATLSFLAPAFDEQRSLNQTRLKAIEVIAAMNASMQSIIPGQVGRFDDTFNIHCAGDHFQHLGTPTILIEAGHFQDDYDREQTREYFFNALLSGLKYISENDFATASLAEYLAIPQNIASFYDFVYKNVRISYEGNEIITNFAAQYKEELHGTDLQFCAYIIEVGLADQIIGHFEFDAAGDSFASEEGTAPVLGLKADFLIGSTQFKNGAIAK